MARKSANQNSFTGGELSSLMLGRQDFEEYYNKGLFVCLNGLPLTQGPWTRRPGFAFLHQTKFNDKESRLFPFQYSTTQTYVLEFGNLYIRFFTSHGILTNTSQSITSISQAATGVVTKIAHGYSNGNRLQLSSVLGMHQLTNREVVVTNKTNDTFELYDSDGIAIATTGYGAFTSGTMAKIFEVVTTYTEAELPELQLTQSADTLYICQPDHVPATLVRTSALSWTLATLTFTDGPYDIIGAGSASVNPGNNTWFVTPSAATGNGITLTATTDGGSSAFFVSTDVGRLMRMREGSVWGYVLITAFTNDLVVTADVLSTLTTTNAKTAFRMGIWSATTGFPRCSAFHDDRLYFAGPAVYPQRLDGSNVSQYTNFSPSATDGTVSSANAVAFSLNADDVNAIKWLSSHDKGILVGTTRGEWRVRGTNQDEAITPTNITGKPQTRRGSAIAAPVVAGDALLFIQRGGRKVREMANVAATDKFKTPDMTAVAEHITAPGISQIVYQEQPQQIVWGKRDDGFLLGLTYDREASVVAWHRHSIGGEGLVESLAVVVDPTETRDELYAIIQRDIDGTKRYVEYMSKVWEPGIDVQEEAFFVDCGYTILNSPADDEVTGLWFLEGETVQVYVDGTAHPDVVVTNGTAALNRTGSIVTLGYTYASDGQTMPLEGGSQDGSAQGKTKIIKRIGFWLLDTLGLKFGPDADHLTELIVREWGEEMGAETPLATGVVRETFEGSYDRLGQVYWRCDGPFPATVCALLPQFDLTDDS